MKLLAICLAVFTCVCALSIPRSHGVAVGAHNGTLKAYDYSNSIHDVQLGGKDAKKGVPDVKVTQSVLVPDDSIAKPILIDDKKMDTSPSTIDSTDLKHPITSRTVAEPPEAGSFAESIKQLLWNTIDEYNQAHPLNRIPDWILCFDPAAVALTGTRHEGRHIFEALQEAHRLRTTVPYLDRPRWEGTHYPHVVTYTDLNEQSESRIRRVDMGHHIGDVHMHPIIMGGGVWRTGYHPFMDRIMFDDNGAYLGSMTFRGRHWYFCIPGRYRDNLDPGHPDRGASASGVPGADETMMRFEFPARPWLAIGNEIGGGSHMPPPFKRENDHEA